MGGMAAQIPIKNDSAANQAALEKVRQDKLREVWAGHDGTWVAHPGLVPIARDVFDTYMPFPNQIEKKPAVEVNAADLLTVPDGEITRGRPEPQYRRRPAISGHLALRQRLRADL